MLRISLPITRLILFLALPFFLYSCNSTLSAIERDGSRWVKLGLYDPQDYVIFDFGKREVKTAEGKLYRYKVKRNTFYWTDSRGPAKEKFSNVMLTDDTLKIIGDDFHMIFLKYDLLVPPKMIVADSLVGPLFKVESLPRNNKSDSVTKFIEFVSNEKGAFHTVHNGTGEVNSEVFSWTLHQVDEVFILASVSWLGPRFLITEYGNDTIKAVQPIIDFEKDRFSAKTLVLMEEKSAQPKVSIEDLIGEWEVAEFKTPYYQMVWSVRITRDRLFINEHVKGIKLNVPWHLDSFGNLIKANLKNATDANDPRRDIHKLSIYFNDGKLIVADGIESYTLKLKP